MTTANSPIHWVLLDETGGAQCQDGSTLSPDVLTRMAQALSYQLAHDYGCDSDARAGKDPTDILPGERVYTFRNGLPEAPGAVAYHSVDGSGVEFGMQDITACSSLWALDGALMAASHEFCETEGDRGCDGWSDDGQGTLHAQERCDAIETQGYPVTLSDGTQGIVANFLLDVWFIPGAAGPYTYAGANGMPSVEPPGPMQIAPSPGQGNYDSVEPAPTSSNQVFGFEFTHKDRAGRHMRGRPKDSKKAEHWSSRTYKRGHRLGGGA